MITALAVLLALAVMAALGKATALVFHHDHTLGHCGWSGCRAGEAA